MPATVGTTTSFNMTVDEIINFVLEGLGGEHITAKEAKNARTALNLLLIDLQNEGMVPLASLELTSVALTCGSSQGYSFGSDVFSMFDMVIQEANSAGNLDLGIEKMSYDDWLRIPTKTQTVGRPSQILVQRGLTDTTFNVWPVPDRSVYSIKGWALKKIADVDRGHQLVELPTRYLPAIIAGLRYYMAKLRPGSTIEDRAELKAEYDILLEKALGEDRERVGLHYYPASRNQLGS